MFIFSLLMSMFPHHLTETKATGETDIPKFKGSFSFKLES